MKTSFPVSAKKAIMLVALMLVIIVFTACDKNINGMFSGSSGNIAPSTREGTILTKEEADKMLATDLDIDGDGSIATNSYWLTSQMFPAANKSIKASVRASSSPNGKTILFFTRLNNQWINFTSDLRLALENEGYEVLVQNNDQPLQDLSDIDVLAIIDSLGTPFVSPNDRPLSLQDKTKILNFIASGKGFFFSGDWVFSELSKYNDIAGMFGATLSPNVIDYIPVYENGYVSPYFLPYDWNAYVFDFINFYQTYPSQPIFKRAPLYGYSSFSNADHAIFKNVNQVLLLGSSHIRPKNFQIEAGIKTHPTTSRPRDYPITPEGYPLIVAKNYGAGRVVLSCDSNCFANDGFAKSNLAGTDNKVFAMNVFNWLAKVSVLEGDLTILNPHNNDVFDFGQSINFIGSQTGNITNIEWVSSIDGVFSANTLSVTKSNLSPGTHTIILQGIIGGLPASIRSSARSQIRAAAVGDPVSDSITITVKEAQIDEIRLKFTDTGLIVPDPLKISSLKAILSFKAIGYLAGAEIGPINVTWSLENGDVSPGSIRAGLLNEMNSNVGKIAVFSGSVGTSSTIINSEVATYVSFLSGDISVKATYPNGVSKVISIQQKQPTVYLNMKYVQGISPLSAVSLWVDKAKTIWGQENLLVIKEYSPLSTVGNTEFPSLPQEQSSEYLFSQLAPSQAPSFLNPLVGDVIADNFYSVGFEEHVVPRQSEELFKSRVIGEKLINVFISKAHYSAFKPEIEPEPVEIKDLSGAAISSVRYYSRGTGQKINDKTESGIVITNISELPGDIPDTDRRLLAHELGHILLQTGDDHVLTSPPNVMNDFAAGENILPSQIKIIYDYDKKKNPDSFFIVEE
ncbi:MAG: hypothetical protein GQF41_2372 [Candidatus Rifleibacterium amylolyticum]|nr:MAG: hypothetical protein GQF41_2372 [Candidatus Rifleibacterium amylolyticum]